MTSFYKLNHVSESPLPYPFHTDNNIFLYDSVHRLKIKLQMNLPSDIPSLEPFKAVSSHFFLLI